MTQNINNSRPIYQITDAFTKIRALTRNIVEYDCFNLIFQYELYYILKQHKRLDTQPNINRDALLCELLDKCEGFFIKAQEVKRILNFMKFTREPTLIYSWFMKNIDKGFKPTVAIIHEVIENLTLENIDKIIASNIVKFDKTKIFCQNVLINSVFNNTIQSAHQIFKKYNISDEDIKNIITNKCFSPSPILTQLIKTDPGKFNKYLMNVINYKKEHSLYFTYDEYLLLLDYPLDPFFVNMSTPMGYQTTKNLKHISIKFTDDELIILLDKCFGKYNTTSILYLHFITECCNFDKIDKSNIHKLIIKIPFFSKFPTDIFEKFYKTDLDLDFITSLIINNQSQFILDLLKTPDEVKLLCTHEEIFKVAFEYASIPLIKHFLNNKYTITEEMILNNNSDGLFLILDEATKHGFYITDKCFDHLVFIMYLNGTIFDYRKIQSISIYVNDDDDFKKFIPILEAKYNLYKNLELNILNKLSTTIEYLKNKKVTNEMIILCNAKKIRNYLFDKMNKEKQVKRIIVKKSVKKISN
jgi:hypothetical protein